MANRMLEKISDSGTKRILIVIIIAGLVSAGMGAITFAYFQDTDTNSGNNIQAGTLNITIDDVDDGTSGSLSVGPGKPLDSTNHNYTVRNGGSVSADHLQVNMSFAENDPTGTYNQEPADSDLQNELNAGTTANYMEVTTLTYHNGSTSNDLLTSVSDNNGNGITDLGDVQNDSVMDDLTPPAAKEGNKTYFEITVRIASDDHGLTDPDENVMGDGIDVKVRFTLMQDSSQDTI